METMKERKDRLQSIKETLAPEEWREAKIYRHNDVEFEHFTLVATEVSSGQIHYYDPDENEFKPLNLSVSRAPTAAQK